LDRDKDAYDDVFNDNEDGEFRGDLAICVMTMMEMRTIFVFMTLLMILKMLVRRMALMTMILMMRVTTIRIVALMMAIRMKMGYIKFMVMMIRTRIEVIITMAMGVMNTPTDNHYRGDRGHSYYGDYEDGEEPGDDIDANYDAKDNGGDSRLDIHAGADDDDDDDFDEDDAGDDDDDNKYDNYDGGDDDKDDDDDDTHGDGDRDNGKDDKYKYDGNTEILETKIIEMVRDTAMATIVTSVTFVVVMSRINLRMTIKMIIACLIVMMMLLMMMTTISDDEEDDVD
jgi:hypothetical protein